ncbi:MAG: hypothetical protein R3F07_19455 [Opitutaceae bacterium]
MDLELIINETADQADDILAEVTSRKEARPVLTEYLKENHPELDPDDRLIVMARVLQILDEEEFFATGANETDSVWGETADEAEEPTL